MVSESLTFEQNRFAFPDGVVLEKRGRISEVTEYIQETLPHLRPLKYIIDDFDPQEAYDILDEDLPNGSCSQGKEMFIRDIVRLSAMFFRQKVRPTMNIQLEIVQTNKCRLFHEDYYRQRLLCTYHGPGTQWLEESNVNRKSLGRGRNADIVKDVDQIQRAQPFDVILLKGAKHEAGESVIHRSPPIEDCKVTRVLLKIDE